MGAPAKLRMLIPSPVAARQSRTKRSSNNISVVNNVAAINSNGSNESRVPPVIPEESTENVPPISDIMEDQMEGPPAKKMKMEHAMNLKAATMELQPEMNMMAASED